MYTLAKTLAKNMHTCQFALSIKFVNDRRIFLTFIISQLFVLNSTPHVFQFFFRDDHQQGPGYLGPCPGGGTRLGTHVLCSGRGGGGTTLPCDISNDAFDVTYLPPPREQTHTPVKTLLSPNFVCGR